MVSGSVHAIRCESVCKANEVLLFGCWTLSHLLLSFSNGVTVRSLMVCSWLQKCSATPDLSTFLLIMSPDLSTFSLNLSFSRLLVCPMFWQFLCPLVKQRLHC